MASPFFISSLTLLRNRCIKELKRERLSSLIELNCPGTTKEAAKVFGKSQNLIDAFYIQQLLDGIPLKRLSIILKTT